MITYESIRLKLRKIYIKATLKYRRKKIINDDFTIISNNCWGGFIYQSYGLEYKTPTIGLFFMAEDYIKFVYNIKKYIDLKLEFIEPSETKYIDYFENHDKFGEYPIGKLGDIEIHFLHYKSEEEAFDKWNRRVKKINWDRILFKFNDQNLCTLDLIEKFSKLPVENKICFTSKECDYDNVYHIKSFYKNSNIKASYEPFGESKYLNINKLINKL